MGQIEPREEKGREDMLWASDLGWRDGRMDRLITIGPPQNRALITIGESVLETFFVHYEWVACKKTIYT